MSKKTASDSSNEVKEKGTKPLSLNDKNVISVHRDFKGVLIGSKRNAAASAVFGQKK